MDDKTLDQQKNENEKLSQLQIIDEKMAKLKAQRQTIISREKEKERKDRTQRLIQNGALAEQYLNCEKISPSDFEVLLKKIVDIGDVKNIITNSF